MRSFAGLALLLASCFSLRTFAPESAPVPLTCGDGKKDEGEACDGAALGGRSECVIRRQGAGGVLACTSRCELDLSGCVTADDDRLTLWLRVDDQDGTQQIVDHSDHAVSLTFKKDGAAAASTVLAAISNLPLTSEPPSAEDRALEVTQGSGHAVFSADDISAATPITYALWIGVTPATPDRESIVFAHESGCTLALTPGYLLRATCGNATVTHPTPASGAPYTFVAVQVGKTILSLWVNDTVVTADMAPVSAASGRFVLFNSLDASNGATKQFVGRFDDLRIFNEVRSATDLCHDAGRTGCN